MKAASAQAVVGGIASVTMRAVAQRAGVTPAAAYHHFPSKEHLLAACAERAFAGLLARFEAALADVGGGAFDRLDALGRAYVAYAIEQPARFRIMFGEHMRAVGPALAADSAGRRARELFEQVATEVAGELGGRITPTEVVEIGWSSVVGVVVLLVERELAPAHSPAAVEALVDNVLASVRGGLRAIAAGR